jgi:outer membrane protein OmpA-like peptidoglycan-associated protein
MCPKKIVLLLVLGFSLCFSQSGKKLNVYFASDKFDLDQKWKKRIDSAGITGASKIYLQGHCDSVGSFEYNDALSNKRVQEVKKYLLAKKVSEDLIHIKALGKRVLLNGNETETDRALNRRVEIEFFPTPKDSIVITGDPAKKEIELKGQVLDDNNKPIFAEVTLTDANGNEIAATITGKNGEYKLKATIDEEGTTFILYFNDQSFISSKLLTKADFQGKPLKAVLPKLKGGKKYTLENFNFVGDTSQLLPESLPTLQALYKLMKRNKGLVIEIEGHVNYPKSWGDADRAKPKGDKYFPAKMTYAQFNQWLSEQRAKMVYDYLIKKGIPSARLKKVGYGSSQMIYPDAENEYEYTRNRRVEIKVVSLK